MASPLAGFLTSRLLIVIIFSAGLILLGVTGWASRSDKPQGLESSQTDSDRALSVISTTVVADRMNIILKNVSNKNINGFQMAVGKARCQVEFLDSDERDHQVLVPGATYEQWYPITGNSIPQAVTILAVIFEDKTSEGDPQFVQEIKDMRKGVKRQLMRFMPILNKALMSPESEQLAILDELEAQILKLPEDDKDVLGNINLGQHQAKGLILNEIQTLKRIQRARGEVKIEQALTNLKNKYHMKLTKLD